MWRAFLAFRSNELVGRGFFLICILPWGIRYLSKVQLIEDQREKVGQVELLSGQEMRIRQRYALKEQPAHMRIR